MSEPLDIDIWRRFTQHGYSAAQIAKVKKVSVTVVLRMVVDVESEMGTNRLSQVTTMPQDNHQLESLLKSLLSNE
jgi:hypothetical protein